MGSVKPMSALALWIETIFKNFDSRDIQTQMLLEWIKAQDLKEPLVLVTHQVNITALTGVFPNSGELVIVHLSDSGELSVVGTIEIL